MSKALASTLLAAVLAACGGGGKSSPSSADQPVQPVERGMKEQLEALEKAGELPALDHSTDIAGPDIDRNGIRDDVDAYIAALPVNDAVKKAALQVARVQQKALLINLKDQPALLRLANAEATSNACMSSAVLSGVSPELESRTLRDGHAITFKIEAITANTPERAERYLAYMGALHGTTTTYPTGKVCEDE
jgi:hypothetical protein